MPRPEAREVFAKAGARVLEDMAYIGRDIVASALKGAPKVMKLRAATPLNDVNYALGSMIFAPGAGCLNVSDFERGQRPGSLVNHEETIKLAQIITTILGL